MGWNMRKRENIEVKYLKTSDLIPYASNAKIHNSRQIDQIKESIKEFGFNDPIAIDENNVILEGHGRLIAANELGIEEVPVFFITDLNEEEKRAYMLIHNQLTNSTDFDIDLLNEELENITDINMSKYDFMMEPDTFFDEDKNVPAPEKLEVLVVVEIKDRDSIKTYLDENLIEYKEKYVR